MRGPLLRLGLRVADAIARLLPSGLAYALADLGGRAWYRLSPERRMLVTENLRRVAAATGRPTSDRAMRRMVQRAYVNHARYWLEMLRSPHYRDDEIPQIIHVDDWDRWEPVLRSGLVIALPHLGNFEPYGHFVVGQGLRAVAPVEETDSPDLFDFIRARRASGKVEVVPLSRSYRPMLAALRRGDLVALIADRDLAGDGVPVTMFGHATTLPAGPATLALRTDRPLMMARVLRTAPDRFSVRAELVEAPRSGHVEQDVAALTAALAERFEAAIAEAPEQWFAAFQPYWTDQRAGEADA